MNYRMTKLRAQVVGVARKNFKFDNNGVQKEVVCKYVNVVYRDNDDKNTMGCKVAQMKCKDSELPIQEGLYDLDVITLYDDNNKSKTEVIAAELIPAK